MDNFMTWEYLLSFAGCVAATGLLTEFVKKLFENLSSKTYQIISYFIALLILLCGQFATKQMSGWEAVALDLINAAVVSLASNGGYDAIKSVYNTVRPKTDEETEMKDEGDEE